jgi:hypothetical protein
MAEKTQAELDAERLENERIQLAITAKFLESYLKDPASKEVLYESFGSPQVLLRIFNDTAHRHYFCVVRAEGLAPYRNTNAEERQAGILSLSPPALRTNTIEKLIAGGSLAMQASAFATPGVGYEELPGGSRRTLLGPGELAMMHYRTARAIRHALRLLDEDI